MKKFLPALFAAIFVATLSFPTIAATGDATTSDTPPAPFCPPWC